MTPADFEILDNGVAQQVDLVSFDQVPLNVVLVFDMSNSVEGDCRDRLLTGAGALLNGLKADDQAALVSFSHVVDRGAKLTSDVASVRAALERAEGIGETAVVDGTFAGMMVGESDVGRGLLIVFSDGVDTASWLPPASVLDTAKRSGVVRVRGLGEVARPARIPRGAHVVDRRPVVRSRADAESRIGLPRRARRIPPPLPR